MESTSRYAAHAFHDSFDKGRASGELTVYPGGFRFRTDQREVTLPLSGAQLRLGGASDRLLFITHPAHPGWSVYTSDLSILKHETLRAHAGLSSELRRVRSGRILGWSVALALVAAIVAVPVALVLNLDYFAGVAARRFPPQWERQLGESAFAQYRIGAELLEDADAQARLDGLTGTLTAVAQAPRHAFRFHVAKESTLNAFALPGGTIVIHSELILRAASADELLGVLAHEMSHVTEQHGLRNIISSAGILLTAQALLGDVGGLMGTVAAAAPFLMSQRYSRSFENEADERGFELMQRAQIDAHGLVRFFERIKLEEQKAREKMREHAGGRTAEALEAVSPFLSSHPATDARIARIEALAQTQGGPYRDLNAEFLALQTQVRHFVAEETSQDAQGGMEDAHAD